MKASYVVAPIALDDIDDAAAFVAESDPNAARRLIDDLYDSFQRIADQPGIGHARTDLTLLPVFFWTASQRRYAVIS